MPQTESLRTIANGRVKLIYGPKEGSLIRIIETANERDEAFTVSALIRRDHRENKIDYSDIAILYRTNAQSRVLEEGLIGEGIPYKIVGSKVLRQKRNQGCGGLFKAHSKSKG